jgi:RES domain-containing protein
MKIPLRHTIPARLTRNPLTGTWYRAIPTVFLSTALNLSHSRTVPGRFNDGSPVAPSFPILYLAENHMLALFEVEALFGSPAPGHTVPNPGKAVAVLNVNTTLREVADLTNLHEQSIFDTNVQELTGDWRGFKLRNLSTPVQLPTGTAPTQELGAALYAVPNLEGFVTVSAKLSYQKILVVFPDKLHSLKAIEHVDQFGTVHHLIP